ncbi:MAG: hypothetical protein IAG10_34850, partial [Planctomycetaceae bacterium]|nr:hypothetical protein [Planctomycetaceae bacterium]
MSTKPSCKLYVYLANDAKKALILRRGPTRWFHLILWHMQTDKFEFGSWFHGRIYEDRCDLSPDGRYVVYFAANQTRHTWEQLGSNAWTAICQPPWVKAITLDVSSCGTWGGGGRFISEDEP